MKDKNEYSGIGVGISEISDGVAIVIEGGPAQSAGILVGDIISEIDGETTRGMTTEEVTRKMQGRSGTRINIRIVRSNVPYPINFTITKAVIDTSETEEDEYLEEMKVLVDMSVPQGHRAEDSTDTFKSRIDKRLVESKAGTLPTFKKKIMMNPLPLILVIVMLVVVLVRLFGVILTDSSFILVVIICAVILCIGFFLVSLPLYKKLTCTQKTIAEVVDLRMSYSDGSPTYAPTFSYNANGKRIVVLYGMYQRSSPYKIGGTLTLFYNPSKPESCYLGIFAGGSWAIILVGLVLIGLVYFNLP